MDFQPRPKQADLLAERVTDSEVRILLERLGQAEMGGPEDATVGAIVEATGASSRAVAQLLAEIRQEDFESKYGLKLKRQENRIDCLENRTSQLESRKDTPRENTSIYFAPVHEEDKPWLRHQWIGVGLGFIAFLLLLCSGLVSQPSGQLPTQTIYTK